MRRTFWLAAGFGLGLYAGERVRRTVVKLTPETFAAPEPERARPRLRLASGGAGEPDRPGR